jgi:glycosyltransferase involved in cell wall biosynthesis
MNRPQITVVNLYDIFPINHGGKLAIYGLYSALSEWFEVNLVTLNKILCHKDRMNINKHFKIFQIERTPIQKKYEKIYADSYNTSTAVTHIMVMYKKAAEMTKHIETLIEISKESSVLIAEHVYTWPLIKTVAKGKRLWYRAQNVEYDYMKQCWKEYNLPESVFNELLELERECCMSCDAVFTISDSDKKRFQELYGIPEEKIINISAGYYMDGEKFTLPSKRENKKDGKYNALYISSSALPAIAAGNEIANIASDLPNINFTIAGKVGTAMNLDNLPENVNIAGQVSEYDKDNLLRTSDFALNPIVGGSGLNIKMLEYFAYGLPVITTEFGARGIDVISGTNCILTDIDDLKTSIMEFCALDMHTKDKIAINANNLWQEKYSWRNCALKVVDYAMSNGLRIDSSDNNVEMFSPSFNPRSYFPVKSFYIRGAGIMGLNCLLLLKRFDLCPVAFLDEDSQKHGTFINGIEVISSENCLMNDYEVVLALADWPNAAKHLLTIGVNVDRLFVSLYGDIFKLVDMIDSNYIDIGMFKEHWRSQKQKEVR